MNKFRFVMGIAILAAPLCAPVLAQDDFTSIDLSSILNQGGNNRGNNRGPSIPDSKVLAQQIEDTLKKGKTPLEKEQKKPLQNLLDTEIVALTDKLQLMRNNNGYPNNNNNNTAANTTAANTTAANNKTTAAKGATPAPNPPSEQAIKIDTITTLKNEDFLNTKLALFLSPEQVALVQKAHAEDKNNSTCLGGLLDHYFNQMNNSNRGNNNNNNFNNNRGNNNNNNNNNNSKEALRPNGQKYCMTQEATPLDRVEPIRKVLAKGNLPLAADKNTIVEVVMKAQLQDLDAALRAGLTSNNNNNNNNFNRGNNNNNNNRNNFQQVIQTTTDNLYKKVEAMLNPMQAATIQKWHYTEMLSRTPIDALIAVNAMQDTPLSEEQITKVTTAWPELRKEIEKKAKDAKLQLTEKQRDSEAMRRILDMIEPEQVASYQLAKKYGPEAVAGK